MNYPEPINGCLWWFEQQIGIAPTIIPAKEGE